MAEGYYEPDLNRNAGRSTLWCCPSSTVILDSANEIPETPEKIPSAPLGHRLGWFWWSRDKVHGGNR